MLENTALFFKWAEPLAADIDAAQHSILITALSFHPPRSDADKPINWLWRAVKNAAARGVQVEMILPAPSRAHPATAMNGQAAERLRAAGCLYHFAPPGRLLHAKTAVMDARLVWVGSGNWTAAAAAYNHEAYLRIESAELARKMRTHWIDSGLKGGA